MEPPEEKYPRHNKLDENQVVAEIEKRNKSLADFLVYTDQPSLYKVIEDELFNLDYYGCLFGNDPNAPSTLLITTPSVDKPKETLIDNYYTRDYRVDIANAVSGENLRPIFSSFADKINFINFAIYRLRLDLAELAPIIQTHVDKELSEQPEKIPSRSRRRQRTK